MIYGYWDVKALASNEKGAAETLQESGLVWPYAAIRSEAGVTHARGGEFYTYFGEENTYSIYSEGGTMTVGLSGESSEPPEFQAIGKGVCINMEGQETGAQRSAPSLTIENGDFSSTLGDTIKMSGGEMEVKKGSFTKNAAVSGAASGDGASNGSAISISGGTLNMKGSETDGEKSVSFTVNGNYVNGIKMEKAEDDATANIADTIKNAAFSFNNKSYGNSVAAIQVIGGALNVSDSTFTVNGFGNFGVYSSGGTVTATDCTFTMTQAGDPSGGRGDNFGIYSMRPEGATKGGTATAEGCTINITGTYSAGVLSMDGTLNLGASKTKETLITVSFEGNELSSSGVSSEGGEINLTGNTTITSAGLGITARGEINVTGGTSTVETKRGTGIYVQNGTLTISEGATVEVDSKINDTCSWVVPPEHTGEESLQTNKYNGVFVNGGSLKSEGELNVTFTGVENENRGTYLDQQIKSYAVRVEGTTGTTVTIVSGNILNGSYDENGNVKENSGVGGGVYVGGGTVTLGKQETTNSVTTYSGPTVQTTGELLFAEVTKNEGSWPWYETTYTWEGWKNVVGDFWQYMLNKSGGHAVEVSGGSLTVHGGNYTAQQGNGILIRNTSDVKTTNTVKINSGSFLGYNSGYYVAYGYEQTPLGGDRMVGPAASYGLNVMGHDLDVTINGGTFGETGKTGNSAASFFGTPAGSRPQVAVHGGTFNANNADAISVFRFIDITFDGEVSSEVSGETDVASLSVQNDFLYTGESARGSTITIQSGTFTGTAYGIWYGSSTDKLNIYGGRFTGAARSGLYFEVNQWNGSLQKGNTLITGGTFIGISSPHGDYWTNGAIGAPSSGINEGVGYSIQIVDFIDCNSGKSIYYFEDSDSQQADNVTALSWYANNKDNRDVNKINQTTCKYNKVIIQ